MHTDYLEVKSTRNLALMWGCSTWEIARSFKSADLPMLRPQAKREHDTSANSPEKLEAMLADVEKWILWKAARIVGVGSPNFDDVAQAGRLYALQSVSAYQPSIGSFLTFIRQNCYRTMCRAAVHHHRTIRVPAREWQNIQVSVVSLDAPVREGESESGCVGDTALREEERVTTAVDDNERQRAVDAALSALPERWASTIRLRYIDGMDGGEIGRELGISRQRVNQILKQATANLQENEELKMLLCA